MLYSYPIKDEEHKGPGYFQAWKGYGGWCRNSNARDFRLEPFYTKYDLGERYRCVYVPPWHTIADVLNIMNGKQPAVKEEESDMEITRFLARIERVDQAKLENLGKMVVSELERRKALADHEAKEARKAAWYYYGKPGLEGFNNFLLGFIHALGCDRTMRRYQLGHPSAHGELKLDLMSVAKVTADFLGAKTRDKDNKQPPWLSTAQKTMESYRQTALTEKSKAEHKPFVE